MNHFPAVIVCGPPHVGKSTLVCALTRALRQRQIAHYVLRAAPDGEGDWTCDAPTETVRRLRRKSVWTPSWVDVMSQAIARRHLPLLVDMGGRPRPRQERIMDQCGYAILLWRSNDERATWLDRIRRHNLTLLADLRSAQDGAEAIDTDAPGQPLRGVIAGLVPGRESSSALIDQLTERLAQCFAQSETDLLRAHLAAAPWADQAVNLVNFNALIAEFAAGRRRRELLLSDIPRILLAIPGDRPLALYGRMWAPLALALAARRRVDWLFTPDRGWLAPAEALPSARSGNRWLGFELRTSEAGTCALTVTLRRPYLPYERLRRFAVPRARPDCDLVISGKLPMWALCALGDAYRGCRSLRVYEPRAAG